MPAPLLAAGIIAGAQLAGQGINALSQSSMNKKTRKWNEKMYRIQREDALSDYHMQNLYNHPSSQMARLREAGLNPNLVYGNGADAQGGVVRSTNVESWNPSAPQVDLGRAAGESLSAYYDVQTHQAQIDNLRVQNSVLEQEKLLKAAQTLGIIASTKGQETDNYVKDAIKDYTIANSKLGLDKSKAEVEGIMAETQLKITENETKKMMQAPNLDIALQQFINMRKDALLKNQQLRMGSVEIQKKLQEIEELKEKIHNLYLDGELKEFELELKRLRQEASDWPSWMKVFNDVLDRLFRKNRNMRSATK